MDILSDDILEAHAGAEQAGAADAHLGGLVVAQEVVPALFDADAPEPKYPYRDALPWARLVGEPGGKWAVIDSPLKAYEQSFMGVLGEVDHRIVNLLPSNPGRPVVAVDLMATPAALRDLRQQYLKREGAGASFRGFALGLHEGRRAANRDVQFIYGNVRRPGTMRQLSEEMGGQADLIMERAVGGLGALPHHRKFYEAAFAGLWRMLRPGGVKRRIKTRTTKEPERT